MSYWQLREKNNQRSKLGGVLLAVGLHAGLAVTLLCNGLTYLDPPPPEESFVIDFTQVQDIEPMEQKVTDQVPQAEEPDPSREHELVQRSEAKHVGKKPNKAPEATVGDKGDVEVKESPREKPIDNRALFTSANNKAEKDTLAPQTASTVSDKLKAGHPKGNTSTGKAEGAPNAHLKGRSVLGALPRPDYAVQDEGKVVVDIWVDNYGNVTKAVAGGQGTTVSNQTLWAAARAAAMKAHFNQSADAPALQQGTITYIFKLK